MRGNTSLPDMINCNSQVDLNSKKKLRDSSLMKISGIQISMDEESETLPALLLMLIQCQAQPWHFNPPPPSPVIKTGGAQLSLWSQAADRPYGNVTLHSKKTVNGFSVAWFGPAHHPIYFWKHAGADWAMISLRELCFPLNITSPPYLDLTKQSQGEECMFSVYIVSYRINMSS